MNTRIASVIAVTALAGFAMAGSARAAETKSPLPEENWQFIDTYCSGCHNATDWAGGAAFETLDKDDVAPDAKLWEEAVRKLRGHQMPPPGEKQPDAASRKAFMTSLETSLDRASAANINPGTVVLHRLNRPEYAIAIHELLDLDIDPDALLPRDDSSAGFDNMAEVLKITPSFLEQYLAAARQVSVEAMGNPSARTQSSMYSGSQAAQQYMYMPGMPLGTRGGMIVEHNFPVDGDYEVTVSGLVGGGYVWGVMDPFTLIITVDGERVFQGQVGGAADLKAVDVQQAVGVGEIDQRFRNIRVQVPAGRHSIGVTYKQKTAAEHNEVLHGFVPVVGMGQMVNGNSGGPRISNVEIKGPLSHTGVSETPSRRKLLVCKPASAAQETPCARQILGTLAKRAYRRPVTDADLAGPMAFYEEGRKQGTFDDGIQKGVMAVLASPKFLYRFHTPPAGTLPGQAFALSDLDLATRLSYFLWSAPPDETLIDIAAAGRLKDPGELDQQVHRMLADPRARSLATNFAGQWLNVRGLELVNPDTNLYPDYTDDLVPAFREELYDFVWDIFGNDRSVQELMTSEYSFLNERLAMHYGIKGVRGGEFRKVRMEQPERRGLLGKGAVLMATSYANRTSPVVRGAYVLEHIMGTPPTSPPPGVEAFKESQEGGEQLTVRSRLEAHRKVKSCGACHGVIDPVGLSLENYNALGQWRAKDIDAGAVIDAAGKLADGTPVNGVNALRDYIVGRPDLFVQTLTENLLTYALGRPTQYYDMPLVRKLVRDAAANDFRFSTLVTGIVSSPAFLTDRAPLAPVTKNAVLSASTQERGQGENK